MDFWKLPFFPQLSNKSFKTFLKPLSTALTLCDQKGSLTGCQISEEDEKARSKGQQRRWSN